MLDYKGERLYADRSTYTHQHEIEEVEKADFIKIGMNNNFDDCPF
jgi:hypothetical protein